MNLEFDIDSEELSEPDKLDLQRIALAIETGLHEFAGPPPDDAFMDSIGNPFPTAKEVFDKSFVRANAYETGARRVTISTGVDSANCARSDSTFSLAAAVTNLLTPLYILVENQRNDGDFLVQVWSAVEGSARLLPPAPTRVTFRHGGGIDEMTSLIRKDGGRIQDLPFRTFVVVDSDSRYPGHMSASARDLVAACGIANIAHFVLSKRAIENYISDRLVLAYAEEHPDTRAAAELICKLSPPQRDHFPFKKGYLAPPSPGGDENRLYKDVIDSLVATRAQLPRMLEWVLRDGGDMTHEDLKSRFADQEIAALAARVSEEL